MTGATPAYRLGAGTRRSAGGRLLVGGRPPRAVRLGAAGAAVLDAALAGESAAARAERLIRRLVSDGLLDPVAGPVAGTAATQVTFVVPVRDGGWRLGALVAGLRPHGPVIVVDDGSVDDSAGAARRAGATVVANEEASGPGGARNTGWRLARTEFVAFVDADCRVADDWAGPLATLLAADPTLALAAPRVRAIEAGGRLARWEGIRSPLDLGADAGLVGPGRRVPFVPSAALVARRAALVELGGFDGGLRFGEDVDLVWRALRAGWSVRYAPELEVGHPARPTLRARARQHFDYGTSAAVLERRHPGSAAPLQINRIALPAALLAAGRPRLGLLVALAQIGAAARHGGDAPLRLALARLALEAHLTAGRELARAASRDWLALTLLAATRRGPLRRAALLALAVDLAASTAADPAAAPLNALLRLADNAAYSTGLWRGALASRSARAILPTRRRPPAEPADPQRDDAPAPPAESARSPRS